MAQLIVRKIEDQVVRKLRQKAALDGVSMEEEHSRILRHVLLGDSDTRKKSFKDYLLSMPNVGKDDDFVRPPAKLRKVEL